MKIIETLAQADHAPKPLAHPFALVGSSCILGVEQALGLSSGLQQKLQSQATGRNTCENSRRKDLRCRKPKPDASERMSNHH